MKTILKDAIKIVEERISLYDDVDLKCVILYDKIIETEDYWVFFYNSLKFIETGDYSHALAGNAPFIVDKYEGKIYETGTSSSIEYYIKLFEQNEIPQIKSKVGLL